ncbi:TadE/TadG family type IV pilus assembly protein [Sphingomonas sp.]|uniref:TadE/TadG family type IV pilus assembly protein n=1 Tax=Sphingomonas sp. TaxID=28214 RepID=UPI0025E569C9|nr:TadE/TadG family type IV pilus assembly protein [Sphingomonas sp.]
MILKIKRDERGLATIEMAFALPILLLFIYGIFQVGMIMAASAGMQHALGEGARLATIYPTPTDTAIKTQINNKLFGAYVGKFTVADPVADPTGKSYKDLSVTYTVTPNYLFFTAPDITLVRSKRVYLSF